MEIKINKIRFSLSFSFVAVLTLMLIFCDEEIVTVSMFSSLFHEGGHLFFMLLFGERPSSICFGAFGIRIERYSEDCLHRKKEALIALGGIVGNCLLFVCGSCFYFMYNSTWAARLMAVNFFIAAFNMLPVGMLDFGRCLRCIFGYSDRGERVVRVISLITAASIGIVCIIYNVFVNINVSLIAVSIYIILITTLKE